MFLKSISRNTAKMGTGGVSVCVLLMLQEGYGGQAGALFPPSPRGHKALTMLTKTTPPLAKLKMKGVNE